MLPGIRVHENTVSGLNRKIEELNKINQKNAEDTALKERIIRRYAEKTEQLEASVSEWKSRCEASESKLEEKGAKESEAQQEVKSELDELHSDETTHLLREALHRKNEEHSG